MCLCVHMRMYGTGVGLGAGSRPSPAQGVWAEGTKPPWACDLHLNVNLQMAYWPAGPTGLYPEAAVPLAGFLFLPAQSARVRVRVAHAPHTTHSAHAGGPSGAALAHASVKPCATWG